MHTLSKLDDFFITKPRNQIATIIALLWSLNIGGANENISTKLKSIDKINKIFECDQEY